MRWLWLTLVACSLFVLLPQAPDPPRLGEPRAAVEARCGPPLTRDDCMRRYDMPVCSDCMGKGCPDVSVAVYPGPLVIWYGPDSGVIKAGEERSRWVCPEAGEHGCGWTSGWWEKP